MGVDRRESRQPKEDQSQGAAERITRGSREP